MKRRFGTDEPFFGDVSAMSKLLPGRVRLEKDWFDEGVHGYVVTGADEDPREWQPWANTEAGNADFAELLLAVHHWWATNASKNLATRMRLSSMIEEIGDEMKKGPSNMPFVKDAVCIAAMEIGFSLEQAAVRSRNLGPCEPSSP